MFGATAAEQQEASKNFLVLLLMKLEEWAGKLGEQFEEIRGAYEDLLLEGVVFPQCVNSIAYMLRERFGRSPEELARQLMLSLSQPNPNTVELVEMGKLLSTFKEALTRSIQRSSEQDLDSLFTIHQAISEALTALDSFIQQGDLSRTTPRLLAQAQSNWASIVEPQSLVSPYLPEDEVDSVPEARSLANVPSFRAMDRNISLRFKDFVSTN